MHSLETFLRRREKVHRVKTTCMLLAGAPLSFVGPAVLATMFWAVFFFGQGRLTTEYGIGWLELFGLMSLLTIPVLYRLELRTKGDYFAATMRETEVRVPAGMVAVPGAAQDLLAVGSLLANSRATSSLLTEFFLFGPRMAIGGFRQAKMARRVELQDLAHAAQIVEKLLQSDSGLDTTSLAGGGRGDVLPSLAYLAFHGWIGVGEGWNKAWLNSESRKLLRSK